METRDKRVVSDSLKLERIKFLANVSKLPAEDLKKLVVHSLFAEVKSSGSQPVWDFLTHVVELFSDSGAVDTLDEKQLQLSAFKIELSTVIAPFVAHISDISDIIVEYATAQMRGLVGHWPLNGESLGRDECLTSAGNHFEITDWKRIYSKSDDCIHLREGMFIRAPVRGALDCGSHCDGLTIALWVKRMGPSDGPMALFTGSVHSWNVHFWLMDYLFARMCGPNGNPWVDCIADTNPLEVGRWYFVATTMDRRTATNRIYCNGELKAEKRVTSKMAPLGTGGRLVIGTYDRRRLNACLRGLQIFSCVLTDDELAHVAFMDAPQQFEATDAATAGRCCVS